MDTAQIVEIVMFGSCLSICIFLTVLSVRAWKGERYLCENCRYNDEVSCRKRDRPKALVCTAYRSLDGQDKL